MNEIPGKKRWWMMVLQLAVIITVIWGLVYAIEKRSALQDKAAEPPAGWQHLLPGFNIMAMVETGGLVWVGGKDGLKAFEVLTGNEVTGQLGVPDFEFIFALEADESGKLWVGHDGGLSVLDGTSWTTLTTADGLPDIHVRALSFGPDGSLWIGTTDGAAKMSEGEFEIFRTDDGLLHNMARVIFCDSTGGVWIGSYAAPEGGVSYFSGTGWEYFSVDNGLPHNDVTCFAEDAFGAVWVGTGLMDRGGAVKIERQEAGRRVITDMLDASDGLSGNKVRSILQDSTGAYWFGSEYTGVTRIRGDSRMTFDTTNGLIHPEVTCIFEDSEGNILLGSLEGLTRISSVAYDVLETGEETGEGGER